MWGTLKVKKFSLPLFWSSMSGKNIIAQKTSLLNKLPLLFTLKLGCTQVDVFSV